MGSTTNAVTKLQEQQFDEMKIWEGLSHEEQQKFRKLEMIDITDTQAVLQYGIRHKAAYPGFRYGSVSNPLQGQRSCW